jgi:predicted transcriptional regulator
MQNIKDDLIKIIDAQPDDSTSDEILRELVLAQLIERGLRDSDSGKTISHDELREKANRWRK